MAKRKRLIKNHRLSEQAKHYLVGGVDSPVRAFGYVGSEPVLIKRGIGSKVYDYDGNEYIDYVLSWGALILGHASPEIIGDIKETLSTGLGFGATHKSEIELAQIVQHAIPELEKVRFVNSGTEAVMGAIRLARGYTNRDKILKFEHSYHGHADYLLAQGGSGLATLQIPSSAGVPRNFIRHTLVAPLGDIKFIKRIFKKYGPQIAAVIIEPVGGNYGVIAPNTDFLRGLREITQRYGTLLICDEIITAFRFRFGAISDEFGIRPDLVCLGKIIGGGLPVGAYGGRKDIMRYLAPMGKVYQASTFAGNPLVMRAGVATLKTLSRLKNGYRKSKELTEYLSRGLKQESQKRGVELKVTRFGSMFSLRFKDRLKFRRFYRHMLAQGVYLAPSEFEANFLSFKHTKEDIDKTIEVARRTLDRNESV